MRRFTIVTVTLTASAAFLIGLIVAGSMTPGPVAWTADRPAPAARPSAAAVPPGVVNFADVAARINPAVVNIDASAPESARSRRRAPREVPDFDRFGGPSEIEPDAPRRGAGSGFIIDADGHILTNHHVIENAERITVKLSDGRSLRARVVGSDPATDIALLRVDGGGALSPAPLGDSDALRVGEWVCAIGNPLAYEHTVTVGVVSYIGRKLFDMSLDHYIQTDAAINFGNSGGPLINSRGEVIGINSALSWRASNIGFAVPVNQAKAILPQLRASGRVSRGYIGVTLRDVDADLRRSLRLASERGALVLDVAENSPGEHAGIRPYDVIVSVDGQDVISNDELIREIAERRPGTVARLELLRDGRSETVALRLAERPFTDPTVRRPAAGERPGDRGARPATRVPPLGLSVRHLDEELGRRFDIPERISGVVVSRVEPMSAAADAGIERGSVLMEINRRRIGSVAEFERVVQGSRPGQILALYLYVPSSGQRTLRTITVEAD
jgi:serine protease Do